MRFPERVAAGDQRHRFLVVHRHPAERLSDVPGRRQRARLSIRAFRVDVDEAHLDRGQRILEFPITTVPLVTEPGLLRSPVDVLLGFPDIRPPAAKPEGLESHRLEGAVARQDHQVGPGDLPAVFLLDRPEEAPGLVEVDVVGPAVERGKPLHAGSRAAPPVVNPVGTRGVPGHPDEERSVVPVVGWPPVLRGRHDLFDVLLQGREVEGLELGGIVEVLTHRVAGGRIRMEDPEIQLLGPPLLVRGAAVGFAREGTLGVVGHADVDLKAGGMRR